MSSSTHAGNFADSSASLLNIHSVVLSDNPALQANGDYNSKRAVSTTVIGLSGGARKSVDCEVGL